MANGCGCASACCGGGSLGRIGGVDAGECDLLLGVHLSGDEIEAFKRRVDVWFQTTGVAVASCAQLSPEERAAWSVFASSWDGHKRTPANVWTAGAQYRATCAFARALDAWRETLKGKCTLPGPSTIDPPSNTQTGELLSTVKWVAGAVVVAAVVYGVSRVV